MDFATIGIAGGAGALITKGAGHVAKVVPWVKNKLVVTCHFADAAHMAIATGLSGQAPASRLYSSIPPQGSAATYRPAAGNHFVVISGVKCIFNVSRQEKDARDTESSTLTFQKRHSDIVLQWAEKQIQSYSNGVPGWIQVFSLDYGYWSKKIERPGRSISTITHPDNSHIRLLGMIQEWEKTEQAVTAAGENFHFGALLHGPPGSGKTSTAIALAHELRRPLYLFPPTKWDSVSKLSEVPPGSLLLVEECEQVFPSRDGGGVNKHEKSITSADVANGLSALDGPLSAHGVVRVYTTNHRDRLDAAFLRAGRVDCEVAFPQRCAA